MSDPKEHDKLTPASRKGYDGSSTNMVESDAERDENPEEDDEETQAAKKKGKKDDGNESAVENPNDNNEGFLKALIKFLKSSNDESNAEERQAAFFVLVKFASSDNEPKAEQEREDVDKNAKKKEQQVDDFVKLVIYSTPERLRSQDKQQVGENDIYDELLDAGKELGFDKEIVKELVKVTAEDESLTSEKDRVEKLEEYLREKIKHASRIALMELQEDLEELKETFEDGSKAQKGAEKAESELEKILQQVEENHNVVDDLDKRDRKMLEEYAKMLARVYQQMPDVPDYEDLLDEHPKEYTLNDTEKQEVKLLMEMVNVVSQEDKDSESGEVDEEKQKKQKLLKQNLLAAIMAEQYPLRGDAEGKNEAIRNEIFKLAAEAGLDTNAIEVNEIPEEIELRIVDGKKVAYVSNSFEALVEKQIIDAEPEQVEQIKAAWEAILASADPGSDIARDAENAIDILEDIIHFKILKREKKLNQHNAAPPRRFQEDEEKEASKPYSEELQEQNAEAKDDLTETLVSLLAKIDPLASDEDKLNLQAIASWVLTSNKSPEQKKIALEILLLASSRGKNAERESAIQKELLLVGERLGVVLKPDEIDRSESERGEKQDLRELIAATVAQGNLTHLRQMRDLWAQMLQNGDLRKPLERRLTDAVSQVETILKTNQEIREGSIETEVVNTDLYSKAIVELFISRPHLLKSVENEAVAALVQTIVIQYSNNPQAQEEHLAEKKIAELRKIFSGTSAQEIKDANAMRALIFKHAKALGLDEREIFLADDTELEEGKEVTIHTRQDALEEIVKEAMKKALDADSPELREIHDLWVKLLEKADGVQQRKYIRNAENALAEVLHARGQLAKSEPGEPAIEKEKNTEKDASHEKPFTLVFESHRINDKKVDKLSAWRDSIEARLESQPEGKIAVLLEHGNITKAESEAITKAILKDTPPSEALEPYIKDTFDYAYFRARNEILDELNEKYAGRLHIITEWRPEGHEGEYAPDVSGIETEKDLTESRVADLQKQIVEHVEFIKKRNALMSHMVADALKRDEIVGGVGLIGSAHTPVGMELKKRGYNVDRIFGDKQDGVTILKPISAYVRELELLNKEPSDAELKLVLRAEMRLDSLRTSDSNEQDLLREIHKWMRAQRNLPAYKREVEKPHRRPAQLVGMFSEQAAAYTPIREAADRRTGYEGAEIGDDVNVLRASAAAVDEIKIPEANEYYDEQGNQLDVAQGDVRRQRLQRRIASLDDPEVYRNEAQLSLLQDELQKAVSDAIRNDTSEGLTSLRNLGNARSLVERIARQRNALNARRGYKGLIERRRELDPELYGADRFIHEVLGERMKRIKSKLETGSSQYSDKDIVDYYTELQRWAKIILKNDVRKNPNKANDPEILRLSNDEYRFYTDFVKTQLTKENLAANRATILAQINRLGDPNNIKDADYLRYFMKNVPDPANPGVPLGIPYQRPEDMGPYSPESLGATMDQIGKEYGTEFQVGGAHELTNAEGEFQYHNFIYWIRKKINEDVDYNKDGSINPYQKIIIKLDMGQISMYELLLLIPEYTAQRDFEIRMNKGAKDAVEGGWGEKKENPEFGWVDLDLVAMEMEVRQMTHELRIQFTATSISNDKEQYLGLMKKLHHNNHWTRANNIFLLLGLPGASRKDGKKEIDQWKDESIAKQGSLGKAMSDMLVSYYYLSELTDFHETYELDSNNKPTKNKRSKTFNESMFYRFLEPDGANRFLTKMAEGALQYNKEARISYAQFIRERINVAADGYLNDTSLNLTADQRRTIEQMRNEWRPDNKDASLEVNFTSNEQLKNFHSLVLRNILKREVEDKDIDRIVRDTIVKNLREEYFNKLYDMQVGAVTTKSSNRVLMTKGLVRFGDIKVGKDENGKEITMQQMLERFDPEQILRFDFVSSDRNDPNNPFAQYLDGHPDVLRRKIDEFMDQRKHKDNYDLFKRNEQMMLAFTRHITRIDRKDLNHFRDAEELTTSRDMIRRAFQHIYEKAYGIDKVESEYGWWWVRDYVYLWGIGAMLDCDGIGFRWDGKLLGTGRWRPRRQGKDGGGNPHTFDEFLALSMDFLHHVQVTNTTAENEPLGHRPIFYWLQGGDGGHITPRAIREFDKRSNYMFQQNAEALYVDNTLSSSSEFLDLVSKTEFEVKHIISTDPNGKVVYDYAKAREIFGKWRKAARYAFGKNGIDYREKIWVNGREKTMYEHFFGPKTRALNELIFRELKGAGVHTEDFKYKDPADAILLSIVAAEVAEHRAQFGAGHQWTIDDILQLERFLLDFMTEYGQTEDEEGNIISKPKWGTLFSRNLFASALKAYHTAYYKMYAVEFNASFWGGIMQGIGEGFKDFFKGKWIW